MGNIISLIIGYLFGNFLTAEFVVGKLTGKSPFSYGSRNPGMVNVISHAGLKYGIIVLIGDVLKTVIACFIAYLIFRDRIVMLYAGLGATLGHDYPFWHRFSGGEGVATTCTAIVCFSPLYGLISDVFGLLLMLFRSGSAIGSVGITLAFTVLAWYYLGPEAGILAIIQMLVMIQRQWAVRNRKIPDIIEKS